MSDDSAEWEGASPWLFLTGLLVFLGSGVLFFVDVVREVNVVRSLAANSIGAALLITWAAHDTLRDPNSEVATTGGAAGTALLLYGLYLFGAGVVVAVTSIFHDKLVLGLLSIGMAVVAVLIGFLIFPREAVLDDEDSSGDADAADEATADTAEQADNSSASESKQAVPEQDDSAPEQVADGDGGQAKPGREESET